MVEVAVRDQNTVDAAEADTGLQDLSLGALTTVDEETMLPEIDDLRRQPPVYGWGRGGGSEKDEFEQGRSLESSGFPDSGHPIVPHLEGGIRRCALGPSAKRFLPPRRIRRSQVPVKLAT